jgi:branched-chain amino acid transport system substrate-binding protein
VPGSTSRAVGLRRAATATLILIVTAIPLACSDDPSSTRAGGDRCVDAPGISASQITIGGIFPTSGQQGPFFKAVGSGVQARFHAENEKGGIGGRDLAFVTADDGDGELANLNAARDLVVDEHVFGVIEVSTNADGSGRFLESEGVPVTGWGITSAWGTYRNMFGYRYSTSPKPGGEAVTRSAQFVKDHGGRRIAVVAGGAAASINVANQFAEAVEALGMSVGYKTTDVPLGTTDWGVQVQGMIDGRADTLYTGMAPVDSANLAKAAKTAGVPLKVVLLPAGYDDRFASSYGPDLEGAYIAIDWRPYELHVPAHDRFKENLAAVAPDEFPSQLAMVGWLSADAFIRGLREAGVACPTRSAFITKLRKVKDYTADGLLPPTDFGALFGKMPLCFYYVQLHDSHFKPVGDEPFCGVLLKDYER